jgi:hypothetical protein
VSLRCTCRSSITVTGSGSEWGHFSAMASMRATMASSMASSASEQRLDAVITSYSAATQRLRALQSQARWACAWQVAFTLGDDVLFFVRRTATIWAFDPIYIAAAAVGFYGAQRMQPLMMLCHVGLNILTTLIIAGFAIIQGLLGSDTERDLAVMFGLRLPLLAVVGCGVPSYLLFQAVSGYQQPRGAGDDESRGALLSSPGTSDDTRSHPLDMQSALARARLAAPPQQDDAGDLPEGTREWMLDPIMCTLMVDPVVTETGK